MKPEHAKQSPSRFHSRLSDGKEGEVKEKHVQKQGESKGFSLWSALCEGGAG